MVSSGRDGLTVVPVVTAPALSVWLLTLVSEASRGPLMRLFKMGLCQGPPRRNTTLSQ